MNETRFASIARWLILPLLVGAFALPAAGCRGRRARRGIQRYVAGSMGCPAQALTTIPQGNHRFRVSGCGREAVYHCFRAPYVGFRCSAEMGPTPVGGAAVATAGGGYGQAPPGYTQTAAQTPPPQAAPPQATVTVQTAPPQPPPAQPQPAGQAWTPELGQQIFAQASPHVLACIPDPPPISFNIEYGVDGRIARVEGLDSFPPEQQTCLQAALQYAAVPGGLTQAVVVPFRFR